uniref:Progonadoliberin n=1 Tax=Melopsittacus undulatus TaxID=13146 RepID=A0A8V5GF35_MELUD
MAPKGSLLLLALLLLVCAVPPCPAQHWSHGWYPGGKRDLAPPPALQVGTAMGPGFPRDSPWIPPCPLSRRSQPRSGAVAPPGAGRRGRSRCW